MGEKVDFSVYLTDAAGNKVAAIVARDSTDSQVYYLTIQWDGIQEADLSKAYCVNVVMERQQTLALNIAPSISENSTQEEIDAMWEKVAGGSYTVRATDASGREIQSTVIVSLPLLPDENAIIVKKTSGIASSLRLRQHLHPRPDCHLYLARTCGVTQTQWTHGQKPSKKHKRTPDSAASGAPPKLRCLFSLDGRQKNTLQTKTTRLQLETEQNGFLMRTISLHPYADGADSESPRDAGKRRACQRIKRGRAAVMRLL